jgi:hypothetical protein
MGKPGFGNTPRSFALRVRIVGYASPRWRSAKDPREADRLNYDLSKKRAQEVEGVVEIQLRAKLGKNIQIDYAVEEDNPQNPKFIEIGSHGSGSNRGPAGSPDNAEIDRKVVVAIDKITTTYTSGGVSHPTVQLPGQTDSWSLGVTKVRMGAVGLAIGSVELVLRNRRTNKQMAARADLYGGGLGATASKGGSLAERKIVEQGIRRLSQAADDFIGRGEVYFMTSSEMGFSAFDNQFIRLGKVTGALIIKGVVAYATFPGISHHPDPLVFQSKTTIGFIDLEGWVASGKLHLIGPNPGDNTDLDQDGQVPGSYDNHREDRLTLTFPTGKWDLSTLDRQRLTQFVGMWAGRFLSPAT